MSKYDKLRALGIEVQLGRRGNQKVRCPKCADSHKGERRKDLSVNVEKGIYNCHSASCDFKGFVGSDFERPKYERPPKLTAEDKISPSAAKFLQSRGISPETARKLSITSKGSWLNFNYFRNGERINIKSRHLGEKRFTQFADAERLVYNLDSCAGKSKVILTEGELDVAALVEAGLDKEYGIVSLDSGAVEVGQEAGKKLDCLKNAAPELMNIEEWYLFLDGDGPGQYTQERVSEYLGPHLCKEVNVRQKDANEVLISAAEQGQEPEIGYQTLREAVRRAEFKPVPGVIDMGETMRADLKHLYDHGITSGISCYFPDMDFKWLAGDITLATGIPNHGKSTFCAHLMLLMSLKEGWKWALYTPEENPKDIYLSQLIHSLKGLAVWWDPDYPNRERPSWREVETTYEWLREHFFFIDIPDGSTELPTNKWLNQRIDFLRKTKGVNAYFKDPWNKIAHKIEGREDQYLQRELSVEKFFARSFDAALYVAHPTKLSKEKDGQLPIPNAYNISGGAMFNNMFDNILAVHQPNRGNRDATDFDREAVTIAFHKIKKQYQVGRTGERRIGFDWASSRYYVVRNNMPAEKPIELAQDEDFKAVIIDKLPF